MFPPVLDPVATSAPRGAVTTLELVIAVVVRRLPTPSAAPQTHNPLDRVQDLIDNIEGPVPPFREITLKLSVERVVEIAGKLVEAMETSILNPVASSSSRGSIAALEIIFAARDAQSLAEGVQLRLALFHLLGELIRLVESVLGHFHPAQGHLAASFDGLDDMMSVRHELVPSASRAVVDSLAAPGPARPRATGQVLTRVLAVEVRPVLECRVAVEHVTQRLERLADPTVRVRVGVCQVADERFYVLVRPFKILVRVVDPGRGFHRLSQPAAVLAHIVDQGTCQRTASLEDRHRRHLVGDVQ